MRDSLVIECTSCEIGGVCPQVEMEGADIFKADGGPTAFLIFIGAHLQYPGHWDPQKHHLSVRLGDRKLRPSEIRGVFGHLPWLAERVVGSYRQSQPQFQGVIQFGGKIDPELTR